MKVLIVGGGGREHALAWKCAQSALAEHIFVAPGNAGTAIEDKVSNIDIAAENIPELVGFAKKKRIELTIVGPEAPLVAGIVDAFQAEGLACFGPSKDAAVLEGSKVFTKEFLKRHQIPTANYEVFTEVETALTYLEQQCYPIVIKADGLAAGKGVIIAATKAEAVSAVRGMLAGNRFGDAGHRVVIEEFLQGEEASFIVMCDGVHILPLASSQDHKSRDEGDQGPNTGGMGAYSPAPIVTPDIHRRVMDKVIRPVVQAMAEEGRRYTGFLYAGLMIDLNGTPNVLEFNCRFGDPESQPIMQRLQSDLVELCLAATRGELDQHEAHWDEAVAVGVVLASKGYPESASKGDVISGLDNDFPESVKVFHAGTRIVNGKVVTAGGRVLCISAKGDSVREAQQTAYAAIKRINWDGMFYRKDIGWRALKRAAVPTED
jgi:phosphoribosylamine--glycine ligase